MGRYERWTTKEGRRRCGGVKSKGRSQKPRGKTADRSGRSNARAVSLVEVRHTKQGRGDGAQGVAIECLCLVVVNQVRCGHLKRLAAIFA